MAVGTNSVGGVENLQKAARVISRTIEQRLEESKKKEEAAKDSKPFMYKDTDDPSRPIIVVGGGGMYYEDMKEKAERLREQPMPETAKRNVKDDVGTAVEVEVRRRSGRRTFFIENNPLAKGGE